MADQDKDDFLDTVVNMAERLGLEGDDRGKYVHEHMTRAGYRMVPSYVKEDEGDSGNEGGFFKTKPKTSNKDSGNKNRGGGWFPG